MAQETTRYRQDEAGYGQRSAEQRHAAEDPLAELARLMSQEDELAALTRENQRPSRRPAPPVSRTPAPPAPRPAAPQPPAPAPRAPAPGSFAALAADVYSENAPRASASPAPRAERPSSEEAARDPHRGLGRGEPRVAEPRPSEARPPERAYVPPRPQPTEPRVAPPMVEPVSRSRVADTGFDAVSHALGQPAVAPAPRVARPAAPAPRPAEARSVNLDDQAYNYGSSAVEGDDHLNEAQEGFDETYESYEVERPAPRRNRRLLVVGGAVALVVIGIASVFAFRSTGGGGATTAANQPPVIRADQGPNKVVPAQPSATEQATDGQKLIYDRVGGTAPTGNERVVSSEEQPVDVSQAAQPRVIAPASGNAPTPVQPSVSSDSTEPKRVRTLTVRADGTIVADATPTPVPGGVAPTALAAGSQPAASAPIALSAGTSAPINTSPTPLSATPSIVDNMPAPPAAPPRAPTNVAAAPAPAPAATSAAPAGAYVVQIASVRSEAEAQATWKSWQSKFPNVLGGQPFAVRRADLGDRGVYYRAQVGSFASRDQANALCQALRAQGGDCMVQRN